MPPKYAAWSPELEARLIFEVERRPLLWDSTCAAYRNKPSKDVAWEEVTKILQSFEASLDTEKVMTRFSNMAKTFKDNLNKVRESKLRSSGKGADEAFRPTWPLYSSLQFLSKTCVSTGGLSNLPAPKPSMPSQPQPLRFSQPLTSPLSIPASAGTSGSDPKYVVRLSNSPMDSKFRILSVSPSPSSSPSNSMASSPLTSQLSSAENKLRTLKVVSLTPPPPTGTSPSGSGTCIFGTSPQQMKEITFNPVAKRFELLKDPGPGNSSSSSPVDMEVTSDSTSDSTSNGAKEPQLPQDLPIHEKRGAKRRGDEGWGEVVGVLKHLSVPVEVPAIPSAPTPPTLPVQQPNDPTDDFGKNVAFLLRSVKPEFRMECENKILALILEYRGK